MRTFLLQVIDKNGKSLMEAVTREHDISMDHWQSYVLPHVKSEYRREVLQMIQHQPKIRKLLKDVDWVVDGVEM